MLSKRWFRAAAILLSLAVVQPALAADPIRLPHLNIDLKQTTTSGVSSGAYMATQMHVAYSGIIAGAALVAGGPYGCIDSAPLMPPVQVATQTCMETTGGRPNLGNILQTVRYRAKTGGIDNLSNMKTARVYLFGGAKDTVVTPPVVTAARDLYEAIGVPRDNMQFVSVPDAEHAFVTDRYGNACGYLGSPYLNNCGYDQAGALLKQLYPDVKTPNAAEAAGRPVAFSQKPYIGDPARSGMLDHGYVYIPEACAGGQKCRLHIAFHGCRMSAEIIGDTFALYAGYNRWADVNNVVVLYPQIKQSAKEGSNPRGCWDWFAYSGYDYNLKKGFQPTAIRKMIAALAE